MPVKDVRAKIFYNTDFFLTFATLGGHRLRFRNKARKKLP